MARGNQGSKVTTGPKKSAAPSTKPKPKQKRKWLLSKEIRIGASVTVAMLAAKVYLLPGLDIGSAVVIALAFGVVLATVLTIRRLTTAREVPVPVGAKMKADPSIFLLLAISSGIIIVTFVGVVLFFGLGTTVATIAGILGFIGSTILIGLRVRKARPGETEVDPSLEKRYQKDLYAYTIDYRKAVRQEIRSGLKAIGVLLALVVLLLLAVVILLDPKILTAT